MFGKYADLVILMLVLSQVLTIILVYFLLRKINNSDKKIKILETKIRELNGIISVLKTTVTRVLQVVVSNADEIVCLRRQMNQVHGWLGDVLSISNLIRSEKEGIDSVAIIEELRERVKWARKRQDELNDDDYYKGD